MSRRRPRPRASPPAASSSSDGAVDYDDVSRFEQLLESYFKPPAKPKSATATKPKPSRSFPFATAIATAAPAPAPAQRTPEADLKALKQCLRYASPTSQAQLTKRLFDVVVHQLKRAKRSSVVFSRAMTICSELFARSVAFRALVATNTASFYERLLEAAGESNGGNAVSNRSAQLIAQAQAARAQNAQLQSVLAMLEAWKDDFGDKYPPIAAGYAALEQREFVFPHVRQKRLSDAQREAETQQLHSRIRQVQIDQMERTAPEIEDVIVEMNRIFDILVPTLDAFNLFDDLSPRASGGGEAKSGDKMEPRKVIQAKSSVAADPDDDDDGDQVDWEDVADDDADANDVEWEDVGEQGCGGSDDEHADGEDQVECEHEYGDDSDDGGSTLSRLDMNQIVQAYGLGSSSYQLTIEIPTKEGMCEKSSENEVLFRHLADGILRIRKRFLPLVHDWKQHFEHDNNNNESSNSTTTSASHRSLAYRVADLQQRLELIVSKWEDLVEENEKKQFAKITPSIVSLPLSAYAPRSSRENRARPASRKRRRVVLHDTRGRPKA